MKKLPLAFAGLLLATVALAQPLVPPGIPPDLTLPGPQAAGRFYGPVFTAALAATAVATANRLTAVPVYIRSGSVLKTLSINITTGNAAAWNARLCLYADSGHGLPGSLVADAGTIAVGSGSITGVQTATIAGGGVAVGGTWYWVAVNADSIAESLTTITNPSAGPIYSSRIMGWASLAAGVAGNPAIGVFAAQTFGACPAVFPAPSFGDNLAMPYIFMGYQR